MDRRMRPKIESAEYGPGLLAGIEAFVNILGERNNFSFESLDEKLPENLVAATRPRVVGSPAPPLSETGSPPPPDTPSPQPAATPTPAPLESPVAQPTPSAAPTLQPL